MDESLARRIHQLIALAGSDNENEARNAAYKACELMRQAGVKAADMVPRVERPALPPPAGWTPPPAPPQRWEPSRTHPWQREATESAKQLGYDEGLAERNRMLEAQLIMRAAQAARANYELVRAEAYMAELEAENERARREAKMREERARLQRYGAPKLTPDSGVRKGPVGAGRRERY